MIRGRVASRRSPIRERSNAWRVTLRPVLVLCLIGLAAALSSAEENASRTPSEDELLRFAGSWSRVADATADAERMAAIDAALADLSWLVRKMASGVLRESTAPPPEVRFVWEGDRLVQHLAVDGEVLVRPVELTESFGIGSAEGSSAEPRWRWREGRLEVYWTRDQARGATRFRYEPSDDSLHVAYEIHVTALEGVAPIHYGSRFRRHGPPGTAAAPGAVQVSGITRRDEPVKD